MQVSKLTAARIAVVLLWLPTSLAIAAEAPGALDIGPRVWFGEESAADAWLHGEFAMGSAAETTPLPLPTHNVLVIDPALEAVQFQSPMPQALSARRPTSLAQRTATSTTAVRAGAGAGLASVPYMIGDTGGGTCLGLGGALSGMISHPSLSCGRLNVSEANSPIPVDRVYFSYRHFHNASTVSAYQFKETLDIDQHTLAWENSFWSGTGSLELRLPLEQRLLSDIRSIIAPGLGVVDPLVAPDDGRRVELGNVSGIFKLLLLERSAFALSAGLGFTLPTAQDVNYQIAAQGEVLFPMMPGFTADTSSVMQLVFANETVYLSPFMAWLVAPRQSRWFHQGFLQVEVAANPSKVTAFGVGANDFYMDNMFVGFFDYDTPVPVRADLFAQTLMRLNLGGGYVLADNPQGDWLQRVTALFELHYTTTLEDAKMTDIPLRTLAAGGNVPQTVTIGNMDNRVDILNAALGVSVQTGPWLITNGFIAPIRETPDRAFDFEYNLQAQRLF